MITIGNVTVHHGNCLDILPTLPDCSVDSVVTDPPYELGFMGKDWDNSGIAYRVNLWSEVLRVLKPGGHLLAFGGTRTYHRMAVAIEDAGFEIRDSIHWIYGSGFPKSLDVSKAIDKMDARDEQQARRYRFTTWVRSTGVTSRQIDEATGTFMGNHYTTHPTQPAIMTREHLEECRHLLGDIPAWVEAECDIRSVESKNFAEREVIGKRDVPIGHSFAGPTYGGDSAAVEVDITAPATDAAKQWEGWGTSLKPAVEPVVVARRPLIGTVAANVLQHGTGALNIDGTRVATTDPMQPAGGQRVDNNEVFGKGLGVSSGRSAELGGRWPANVIFDPDAATELDRQQDGASRFFYIAKPSKAERTCNGTVTNGHPTLKPLTLMRYLVRLVTPPGGTVLEPFAGSGTTLMAATMEGFNSIGIEMTDDYLPIIEGRVRWAQTQQQELPL
jgi:DNA modification methylase